MERITSGTPGTANDNSKAFAGDNHAAVYRQYRPRGSDQVMNKILDFMKEKTQPPFLSALDVACGSGQSTPILADHFKNVIGCDVSEAQVREATNANTASNVRYCVAGAENLPVDDESIDLVTVSQAAHWFNFPVFCKEVDRVLKPNGCLAIYERNNLKILHEDYTIASKLNELFLSLRLKTLAPYWNYSVHPTSWSGYADLIIPYPSFERHVLHEHIDISIGEILGYLESLSAYQFYQKDHPQNQILLELKDSMLKTLGTNSSPDDITLKAFYPIHLLLGRKP